jgi:hypothetical protein
MEQWSTELCAFIVETFIKTGDFVALTQRRFRVRFNVGLHGEVPSRNTILLWIANFRSTGSALKKKPPGGARTVRIPENVETVKWAVVTSPRHSATKHAIALGISDLSVRQILHVDLHFHPYKMMVVQELNQRYWAYRIAFAQNVLVIVADDAAIALSDDAHFHFSGCVSKQNFCYWSDANPRQLHERPLHSERLTVWCCVGSFCVTGPYSFEKDRHAVTVYSGRYVHMLHNFLTPEINRREINQQTMWFQQDGAAAHTARASMSVV